MFCLNAEHINEIEFIWAGMFVATGYFALSEESIVENGNKSNLYVLLISNDWWEAGQRNHSKYWNRGIECD